MKRSKPHFKPMKKDKAPVSSAQKDGYELKGRIWIEGKDRTFFRIQ